MSKGSMQSNKSHENRVGRVFMRQGYLLGKSCTRDPFADNYGRYVIVGDSRGNRLPGAAAAPATPREGMTLTAE
jgi:hypothetical protein